MQELLSYSHKSMVPAAELYAVISNPEMLPQLFDHISAITPANEEKSRFIETTRSLTGLTQKINLCIIRTPPERISMTSDHWLLELSMDIYLNPKPTGHCDVTWKVLSRNFNAPIAKTLRRIFGIWYLPKIKEALLRMDQLASDRIAKTA